MNIFVNIGANLLPSVNRVAGSVEKRFGVMNKRIRVQAAETKIAMKELNTASSGLLGMAAAGGLTWSVTKAIGNGAQLSHELQGLRNAGRSSAEVARSIDAANKTITALPTTTLADNIRAINEMTGAFGSLDHAIENLTFNQKIGSMMKNMLGDDFDASHAIASGVRALEIRGTAMNMASYQREMGQLYRAMIFSRGRFNPDELAAFSQTGNIPIKGYSERFMTKILPSLITELGGGDVAGTQAAAFRNQIMGRVPLGGKKLTEEWVRLGLVPPNGTGGNLSKTGWTAGSMKGHALAMSDPFAWMEKVMLPAMAAKGINTKDPNAVILQMSKMFGRETAVRFATMLADPRQRQRLHKDEALINQVPGVDAAYKSTLRNDPTLAWAAMKDSMSNISAVLFGTAKGESPIAVAMVNIANGINSLALTLQRHPWLAKGISTLLLAGAGLAGLKLFGIGLRFLLSPLKNIVTLGLWIAKRPLGGMIANAFIKGIPAVGRMLSGLLGGLKYFGRFAMIGIRAMGPFFMAGLRALGPFLLRGAVMAFGLLSNPVGWAILAATAAVLIWKYRKEIAAGWTKLCAWFTTTAWPAVKNTVSSINWRSVGMAIADAMTFGLASKLPKMLSIIRGGLSGASSITMPAGPDAATRVGPGLAGMRALGGPISAGRAYLVGERGPEVVTPTRSGYVHPAGASSRMLGANDNGGRPPVTFNIYGATDPEETARIVDRRLRQLSSAQSSSLSD